VAARDDRNTPRASLLRDLCAQLFSDGARIDAGRCCAYNAFLGILLLGGAVVLRVSAPPDPLGPRGFTLVVASAVVLLAALIVPLARPGLVPALLAAQGALIVVLAVGFALACAKWASGTPATRSFRYLPGLIVVGSTYGTALWADFGPARARPRPWRVAGFVVGLALEGVVAALIVMAAVRG
jgi:hypothetical protein